MDLVRDLLDIQVRDRHHRACGRVDGVVIELRSGEAPVVSAIEMGSAILAKRVHPRLPAWFDLVAAALRLSRRPVRVPIAHAQGIELVLTLDVDGVDAGLLEGERVAAQVLRRRPRDE
jgi:hypothetical protein